MRILLKLSGEFLAENGKSLSPRATLRVVKAIESIHRAGHEVAITIGGGNIWRWRNNTHLPIPRIPSDFLGMVATLYNANLLKYAAQTQKISFEILTKLQAPVELATPYSAKLAQTLLGQKKIVVLAGGAGLSGYTTDTGAALMARDLKCDVLWKATKVDGIYDRDPVKYKRAEKISTLTHKEYLKAKLGVMDLTAVEICEKSKMPIRVFKFGAREIALLAQGKNTGSLISSTK